MQLPIDHIGILGKRIDALTAEFRRLGFQTTEPTELMTQTPDGGAQPIGQKSAHIMFADTYIELTAVETNDPGHHLSQFLLNQKYGLRLIILRTDNIDLSCDIARAARLQPSLKQTATRNIFYGGGGRAMFKWVSLSSLEFSDALVGFVEHQTPEIVFQEQMARHPNGCSGFAHLIYGGKTLPDAYLALAATRGIDVICDETAKNANRFIGAVFQTNNINTIPILLRENGVSFAFKGDGVEIQLMEAPFFIRFEPES